MTHWIISSIITVICFSIMALIGKRVAMMGVNYKIINLYLFGITFLGFILFAVFTKDSLSIPKTAIIFLIIAGLVAVAGNYYNIKGIHEAPNPGYHLSIIMFRAALVAIFSIFLFKSHFSVLNFLGIIIALAGLILVAL